jgi:hypothetical protein
MSQCLRNTEAPGKTSEDICCRNEEFEPTEIVPLQKLLEMKQ